MYNEIMNIRNLYHAMSVRDSLKQRGKNPPKLFKKIQEIKKNVNESSDRWGCYGTEFVVEGCNKFCKRIQDCHESSGLVDGTVVLEDES